MIQWTFCLQISFSVCFPENFTCDNNPPSLAICNIFFPCQFSVSFSMMQMAADTWGLPNSYFCYQFFCGEATIVYIWNDQWLKGQDSCFTRTLKVNISYKCVPNKVKVELLRWGLDLTLIIGKRVSWSYLWTLFWGWETAPMDDGAMTAITYHGKVYLNIAETAQRWNEVHFCRCISCF